MSFVHGRVKKSFVVMRQASRPESLKGIPLNSINVPRPAVASFWLKPTSGVMPATATTLPTSAPTACMPTLQELFF